MSKTIFITGATDGIGKLTAQTLVKQGHQVLVHGRNPEKLAALVHELGGGASSYTADLSVHADVVRMSQEVGKAHAHLDAVINNAGVFKIAQRHTPQGLDVRFVVNLLAPYVLTHALLPVLAPEGRVINLSSAAQALIDEDAMVGKRMLQDMEAYAQSKLAITIWSYQLAKELGLPRVVLAVNPGSLLASKMVKEGFGVAGKDLSIGANILCKASTDEAFAQSTGKYFDNDLGRFGEPNPGVFDAGQNEILTRGIQRGLEIWRS